MKKIVTAHKEELRIYSSLKNARRAHTLLSKKANVLRCNIFNHLIEDKRSKLHGKTVKAVYVKYRSI